MHYEVSEKYIEETKKYEKELKESLDKTDLNEKTKNIYFEIIMKLQKLNDYHDTLADKYNKFLAEVKEARRRFKATKNEKEKKLIRESISKRRKEMIKIRKCARDLNDLTSALYSVVVELNNHMREHVVSKKI